jgi:hypothetical protein
MGRGAEAIQIPALLAGSVIPMKLSPLALS